MGLILFGILNRAVPCRIVSSEIPILLLNFVLIYLLNIIGTALVYFTRKVRVWTAVNGCIEPVIYRECTIINTVRFAATIGFTFAHFAVLVERTTAAYYAQRYENTRPHLSCSLSVAMWVAICIWTYYVFSDDDPNVVLAECSEWFPATQTYRWSMAQYYCLAVDLAVSLADLALLVVNKRQQSRVLRHYTLRKSYQLKENQLTTRIIFPCSIVHTLAFAVYLAVNGSAYLFVDVSQPNARTILDSTELMMGAYIYVTLVFFYTIRRRVSLGFSVNSPQAVDDYFHSFRLSIAYKDVPTKGKARPALKIFRGRVGIDSS